MPLNAQGLTTGSVTGTIASQSGSPISGVLITVTDAATRLEHSRTTGFAGNFDVLQLPPGDYEVLAERPGYRPVRVLQVPSRPGSRVSIDIELEEVTARVDSVLVIHFAGAMVGSSRPGVSEWFAPSAFVRLPHARREVNELLRLSASSDPSFEVEGLPHRLNSFAVDGVPFHAIAERSATTRAAVLPIGFFDSAELLTNAVDVEWSGFAGGLLSGYTRRGTKHQGARGFASWGGPIGAAAETYDPSALSFSDVQAAALLHGPLTSDSSNYLVGVSLRQYQTPLAPRWNDGPLRNEVIAAGRSAFNLDFAPFALPRTARTEALTAFGRVDWQLSERQAVEIRGSYATVPEAQQTTDISSPWATDVSSQGRDLLVAATLRSTFSPQLASELRASGSSSNFELNPVPDEHESLGIVVPDALLFGLGSSMPLRSARTDFQLSETIHYTMGTHALKFGAAIERSGFTRTQFVGESLVLFGGPAELAARTAVSVQPAAGAADAEFSGLQLAAYGQDTWRPKPGIEITAGVRYEQESVPADEIVVNEEWQRLTGLSNADVDKTHQKISPRAMLVWDLEARHKWILRAGGGVYYDRLDPAILAEVITHDGRTGVRRAAGTIDAWPPNSSASTPDAVLSLLAPSFRAPRSTRATVGLTRSLADNAALHLSVLYRQTDNLPRRVDLNRPAIAAFQDQHGRPVYGALLQQGALLAAQPSANRRFGGFDVVSALNADGNATYTAASAALEWLATDRLGLTVRYVYSQAEDNWSGANTGSAGSFDPGLNANEDWAQGPADLDAPHRVAAGASLTGPGGVLLSAVYRFRSGHVFTPGFPIGVDANGDGFSNDPAYVDANIPGVSDALAAWDCLKEQVGRFAARNSCRSAGVHSLDLRLATPTLRLGNATLRLRADALNLLPRDDGVADAALYTVNPAQPLSVDAGGVVRLPLVANPNFGETRVLLGPARLLRVGVELNW